MIAVGALQGVWHNAPPEIRDSAHATSSTGIVQSQHLWYQHTISWLTPQPAQNGIDHTLRIGVLLDPLSAVMLVVVTLVSLLVQIYSFGYMKREEHPRFYLYMSLFTASMLGLVISFHAAAALPLLGVGRASVPTCSSASGIPSRRRRARRSRRSW